MNVKLNLLVACIISAIVAIPATGDPVPGALDPPTWVLITERDGYMFFDWTDVRNATKYSLDIEARITYFDEVEQVRKVAYVDLSFGTSDRTDGGEMGDSWLAILKTDLRQAVLDALGLTEAEVGPMLMEGQAKVKALNPGKGKGRQNNLFSGDMSFSVLL